MPPVWPEPAAGQLRDGDAARRDQRRQRQRDLVADAAGGVLVGGRPGQRGEVHPLPRRDHRGGPARDLAAVHPVEQDRHRQRRHLLVGHLAARCTARSPSRSGCRSARAPSRLAMITSTASCMLIRHLPPSTLRNPRSTKVPRLSGSPARVRSGNRSNSAVTDSASSIRASGAPRQKCTPTPNARCGVRVAVDVELVGIGEHGRVTVGGAEQRRDLLPLLDDDVADLTRPRWRCARRAAARSRSAASPRRVSADVGPGRRPRRSIAIKPLPKTFTDASWPALSRSTTAATISSSVQLGGHQVGDQVVGRRSPGARPPAPAPGRRSRLPPRPPRRRSAGAGATSYIFTIACDQSRSDVRVGRAARRAARRSRAPAAARRTPRPRRSPSGSHLVEQGSPRARAPAAAAARRGRG